MAQEHKLVDHKTLKEFATSVFTKSGMKKDDAQYCSEALVLTNLWGIDSHEANQRRFGFGSPGWR